MDKIKLFYIYMLISHKLWHLDIISKCQTGGNSSSHLINKKDDKLIPLTSFSCWNTIYYILLLSLLHYKDRDLHSRWAGFEAIRARKSRILWHQAGCLEEPSCNEASAVSSVYMPLPTEVPLCLRRTESLWKSAKRCCQVCIVDRETGRQGGNRVGDHNS